MKSFKTKTIPPFLFERDPLTQGVYSFCARYNAEKKAIEHDTKAKQ